MIATAEVQFSASMLSQNEVNPFTVLSDELGQTFSQAAKIKEV
jgi:hypothetical protein